MKILLFLYRTDMLPNGGSKFNLETAVGRKTNVEDIGVPGERKKFVVTSVVMRHFFILPGAPRAYADFCDPTAISRSLSEISDRREDWPV